MRKHTYILVVVFIFCFLGSKAQLSPSERKLHREANELYNNKQFTEALPLFLTIDSINFDYVVKYRIGACYLNTEFQKLRALPYLEEVSRNKYLEVPVDVYYDLGILYHFIYRFDEAIENFKRYISIENEERTPNESKIDQALLMINICNNAIELTAEPFNAEIEILNTMVNTMGSEFCPMISADEKLMVFMRTDQKEGEPETTRILFSRKTTQGYWEKARELVIQNRDKFDNQTIDLAGLSSDGQTIFLNIGVDLDQDIYSATIYGNEIINIEKLNKYINTPYYEGRISKSSDGTELYFVSDRPGGLGGTDIYRCTLNRRGNWGPAENLGDKINTSFNERSPFLHPDNQTLFFSSEGHKTMGGSDIFKSKFSHNNWSTPENQSYINSTKDDLYFVLNANGQIGYFSSSKNNIYNRHNIYKVNFKDPIPLTLLKGAITAGDPAKPISAEIRVYDKESGERIKYVYNPNEENGKYLMIFPPAKNYDILISAENFLPQLVNVYIPYQTYFYELYQEIHLYPLTIKDNVVGERVTVNNTFYDLYKTETADSILNDDLPKQPAYYEHLLELVEKIIETTDTLRINYRKEHIENKFNYSETDQLIDLIDQAIETSDPITLNILDANAKQKDNVRSSYFYLNGNKDQPLDTIIIGEDTLYTAPPIHTQQLNTLSTNREKLKYQRTSEQIKIRNSHYTNRSYIHKFTIYFDLDSDEINKEYHEELHEIIKILMNNDGIGAEVYGYADSKGEKKYNLSLSKQRARTVLEYMLDFKIDQKKLIAKGFGEIENPNKDSDDNYNRKVEINIFEVIAE